MKPERQRTDRAAPKTIGPRFSAIWRGSSKAETQDSGTRLPSVSRRQSRACQGLQHRQTQSGPIPLAKARHQGRKTVIASFACASELEAGRQPQDGREMPETRGRRATEGRPIGLRLTVLSKAYEMTNAAACAPVTHCGCGPWSRPCGAAGTKSRRRECRRAKTARPGPFPYAA